MAKKARRGLLGTLGFRVLSISFVFLAIPLIIYSIILYFVDYKEFVKNLFEEMELTVTEETNWIGEKEIYHINTLHLIQQFIGAFHLSEKEETHSQINKILQGFIVHDDIDAIIYCEMNSEGNLVAKTSTLASYVGVDFTHYFPAFENIDKYVLIAKDPIFGYSMYIVNKVQDNKIHAVVITVISLEKLVSLMPSVQKDKDISVSVMDDLGKIIYSTNANLVNKSIKNKDYSFRNISYVPFGKEFTLNGVKSFFVEKIIPRTSSYLVISATEVVVLAQFKIFLYRLGFFLFIVVTTGGFATYLVTLRMARPMKQLARVMGSVGSGHLQATYQKDRYGFEINHLGDTFNQMRNDLVTYIEEVKKEKGLKEAFEKELQIGHQIQRALLPSGDVAISGVDIATFYSAAKEVAGDFFDYLELDDNQVIITIADGVGKGISSCLYSFDLRSILKTAALENRPLDELIKRTNNIFCLDTKDSCNFVTLVTGILDKHEKTFQFTNAGHLPVMVKRQNSTFEMFTTKGIALGIKELDNVELQTIKIEAGDYLVFYTDGVTEAQNAKNELYTEERLKESIKSFNGSSSKELVEHIMQGVQTFVQEKEQYDDITLLVFKLQ
jgi:serine phosphatase RsbU (regulator of sigma subunit)